MSNSPFGFGKDEDINEYYDDPAELKRKVDELIKLVKESKHGVAYTGAGISTSANIPDYRSPTRGVWTAMEFGQPAPQGTSITMAFPTYGHVALQKMIETNVLKFITTTNVDSLHRRAGTTTAHLAELHGNCYLERCEKCQKEYLRDFDTSEFTTRDHITGRICSDLECKGRLLDSIVHFGENLPENEILRASQQAHLSDFSLVLGTSMRVSPANGLPGVPVKEKRGKMVICNLQKTPYDHLAAVRIFAPTDIVLSMLMQGLGLEVPSATPEGFKVTLPPPYETLRPATGVVTAAFRNQQSVTSTTTSSSSSSSSSSSATTQAAPQMFAVDPKLNCPHVYTALLDVIGIEVNTPCSVCNHSPENWECLSCGQVFCSRYVNSHAAKHYEETGHPIAASFSDFSIWCYACDEYIKHKLLAPVLKGLALSKFGE
eukprot:TRINITY_DN1741_c0_g1_i1.p1 TRINITY_DN1741_c0_g1~~TRINITY_DN1741_c0_g1_i1.p1  ORF type:complete len:431 (+),score=96.02 TRINITY_DN1741_c0_g1_i1:226-1518(+)